MKSNDHNRSLLKRDHYYIKQCFKLAQKGAGRVSPNPLVGCLIVKDDRIIAKGWHDYFGGPHAEAVAFSKINENLEDATLYCNLEPCCHTNKNTPPCLPLILKSGVKRVVLSNRDPNPEVAGKSIQQMRNAGIEVIEDVLCADGERLNRFFFKHISTGRPWITIKIAQTMDAKIALEKDRQTWITGEEANKFVHQLRSDYDAVLVGSGTLNVDNPRLTVRHIRGYNPRRIIISGKSKINLNAHVFKNKDQKTWIFYNYKIDSEQEQFLIKNRVRLVETPTVKCGRLNLEFIVEYLGKNNINSVLIEGGQHIFSQFIEQNLYDEIIVLQSGQFFGKGLSSVKLSKKIDFEIRECKMLGNGCYINLRKKV